MHVLRIADSKEQAKFTPPTRRYHKDSYQDEDVYNELVVAKAKLLKDFPFWGIIGLTIRLVEIDDENIMPTLATDSMHIFYNPTFVKKLKKEERVFAIGHEISHALYEHAGHTSRMISYTDSELDSMNPKQRKEAAQKAQLWNFAADFVVNDGLVEARVGDFITSIPILHDEKFRGWSVEEVYDYLVENPNEVPGNGQCLDQHIEIEVVPDDQMEGQSGEDEEGQPDGVNGPGKVRMSESDYEKLQKEIQDTMMSAAAAQKEAEQMDDNSAGCIPSGIRRLINDLSEPKVNWRATLRRFVQAVNTRAYSYARPHRGHFQSGMTIPGFRSRTNELDIAIFVDTSGSISPDQLTAFVSEMQGIMNSFTHYKIKAWCFDGIVVEDSVITLEKHGRGNSWNDVKKFANRIGGGGGTIFTVNWDYMKENRIKPRACIMLTDGYPFGKWGDPKYCPAIFFIMGNEKIKAPFGMTIHYEAS